MFQIEGYIESAQCMGCDKVGKECAIIRTESYAGPHCARCLLREVKKRSPKQPKSEPKANAVPVK